ncbi:HAD family phosphatase [Vagococcus sp. BWB3-3]|uniref:HAD family phosphatase n=1 Tax=Vagococcus allomyrinae TaxID=2794353 RepID=A0A940PCL6_9ENTE|nr:Cof-type HAD-IIB family hydrolase [Vagococcus allomyrinae]MBP1042489.1 HAD family phosphatase [Vagococcus allomyrinae]
MKLVAIDLDGTLLNSQHQLLDVNTRALERAKNSGIKIVIATGRSVISAAEILDSMELEGYILALNGTFIAERTKGQLKVFRQSQLEKENVKKAFKIAQSEQITFVASNERGSDRVVVSEEGEVVQEFLIQRHDLRCLTADEMKNRLTDPTINYLKLAFTNQKREKLLKVKQRLAHEGLPTIFSDAHYIEYVPKGINKGTALQFLCDQLGISMDEVLAIGDQENDLELLTMSGIGVAMGNASDKVKACADYVTSTNDEAGVSRALDLYL